MDEQPKITTEQMLKELREKFGDSGSFSVPPTVTDQYPYFVSSPKPRFERPQWLINLFRRVSPSTDPHNLLNRD